MTRIRIDSMDFFFRDNF